MQLQVVTPRGQVVETEIEQVVLPGAEGEFGVLPGHLPFLSAIRPGVLTYTAGGTTHQVAVAGGLADVGAHEQVMVLVEQACTPAEVDVARLRDELARLEQRLQQGGRLDGEATAEPGAPPTPDAQSLAEQKRWVEAQLALA